MSDLAFIRAMSQYELQQRDKNQQRQKTLKNRLVPLQQAGRSHWTEEALSLGPV